MAKKFQLDDDAGTDVAPPSHIQQLIDEQEQERGKGSSRATIPPPVEPGPDDEPPSDASPARRRVPIIRQLSAADCGAACLAMVMGYWGKEVPLDEIREMCGIGRDGTDARAIVGAAKFYGLRSRGVTCDLADLEVLDPGTILHWEFRHFVVFEKLEKDAVRIIDPAMGPRLVPMEQFRNCWTGVALLFEPAPDFERTGWDKKRPWWNSLKRTRDFWKTVWGVIILSVLLQLFGLAVPLLTGLLIDRVIPRGDQHLLLVLGLGFVGLLLFSAWTTLIRTHLLLNLRTSLDAHMTLGFVDHLLSLPYAFFQKRHSGDLIMRMNSNSVVREILTSGALSGLLDGSLVGVYLALLLVTRWQLGVIVVGFALLQIFVLVVTRRRLRDLASESLEAQARAQTSQVELLNGIETLKAMGCERRAQEQWTNAFVDVLNVSLRRGRLEAVIDTLQSALRLAAPLAVLGYGGMLVLSGQLSLGTMMALSAIATGFLAPLATLLGTAKQFQLLDSYFERIDDVLGTAPEQDLRTVQPVHKLAGRITLEKVSFRYSPLSPLVVKDVSVEVRPGMSVAIVGRSGAGKSTLAGLLVGLYQPEQGHIFYDGKDLSTFDLGSLRRRIGIVTQKAHIFGTTIRDNISLGDPALPLEAIVQAAKLARIHDEVAAMGLSYETPLLDGGASISGGQRQRIALARAFALRPSILLLDEATSSLDAVTEQEVYTEIERLRATRIVIAHRLSTVMGADLILVLDDGRVIEQGTHEQLLAIGGMYHRLFSAQLRRSADQMKAPAPML
jgi:ATP-binding cassette, subfamily B, bacterial